MRKRYEFSGQIHPRAYPGAADVAKLNLAAGGSINQTTGRKALIPVEPVTARTS
jgi:hypothetical protein